MLRRSDFSPVVVAKPESPSLDEPEEREEPLALEVLDTDLLIATVFTARDPDETAGDSEPTPEFVAKFAIGPAVDRRGGHCHLECPLTNTQDSGLGRPGLDSN